MDADSALSLWQAMDVIEAQEMLIAMKVSAYPHMINEDREKLLGNIRKIAYPRDHKKVLSTEELRRFLGG